MTASHKLAEILYKEQAEEQGAQAGPQPGANPAGDAGAQKKDDDDIIDADFTVKN